jgi:hypothetical protein
MEESDSIGSANGRLSPLSTPRSPRKNLGSKPNLDVLLFSAFSAISAVNAFEG